MSTLPVGSNLRKPSKSTAIAGEAWVRFAAGLAGQDRLRLACRGRVRLEYPARGERRISGFMNAPGVPAAVRIYDQAGRGRCLFLDFDGDAGQVAGDVVEVRSLLHLCGLWNFSDFSEGGVHIYVPILPTAKVEIMAVLDVLATRYKTLDISPHRSITSGCCTTPGSKTKQGGYRRLHGSLEDALRCLEYRENNAAGWEELLTILGIVPGCLPTPAIIEPSIHSPAATVGVVKGLSSRLLQIAREGTWEEYSSPSEARQAVITGCVAAGWELMQAAGRMRDGRWPGLNQFYARYRRPMDALRRDWLKAQHFLKTTKAQANRGCCRFDTRYSQGGILRPTPTLGGGSTWVRATAHRLTGVLTGRALRQATWVLRALARCAQLAGGATVAHGVRSLALAAGCSHETVAFVLRLLRELPDPPLQLVDVGRGETADTYQLLGLGPAHDTRQVQPMSPAFRVLGLPAADLYDALQSCGSARIAKLQHSTGLSRAGLLDALQTLAAYDLIETLPDGSLRTGSANLAAVGEILGATLIQACITARYQAQRKAWLQWLNDRRPLALYPPPQNTPCTTGDPPW